VTVKAWWMQRQRDPSLASQKTGEQQETYALGYGDRALPTVALGLLRNYRKTVM
jgi:hypothetical protein